MSLKTNDKMLAGITAYNQILIDIERMRDVFLSIDTADLQPAGTDFVREMLNCADWLEDSAKIFQGDVIEAEAILGIDDEAA